VHGAHQGFGGAIDLHLKAGPHVGLEGLGQHQLQVAAEQAAALQPPGHGAQAGGGIGLGGGNLGGDAQHTPGGDAALLDRGGAGIEIEIAEALLARAVVEGQHRGAVGVDMDAEDAEAGEQADQILPGDRIAAEDLVGAGLPVGAGAGQQILDRELGAVGPVR
jgi:hypothetical protein